jgi:anthranilate 1,2-dioxygenase small subunit
MDLARIAHRLEIAELYADYVHCLDADELERWPDFFVDEAVYRITSAENHEAGLPLGLIYATSRAMLRDRVAALREANIYEPQRYRHLVSAIRIVKDEGRIVEATANFLIVRTMQDGDMTVFAAGRYLDTVRHESGGWKFAEKLVVLDSRQIDTLLAIPM